MNEQSAQFDLDTEVRFLRGVGPRRGQSFAQLGVNVLGDLLEYVPRDYEFRPPLTLIKDILPEQSATIVGTIGTCRYSARSRPPRFTLTLEDASGHCQAVWFHSGYLQNTLHPGDAIALWGKVQQYKETLQLVNPRWIKLTDFESFLKQEAYAACVYPACGDLASGQIERIIRASLEDLLRQVEEPFDPAFLKKRNMPDRRQALRWVHRPGRQEEIDQARRRLKYDELFLMELGIGLRRNRLRKNRGAPAMPCTEQLDHRIRKRFPFTLTADQDEVVHEIVADMGQTRPMNRLLHGDVGSGKTVVALYAALLAIGHHYQAAIMAPTELLARQHYDNITNYLHHSRVKRALLVGQLPLAKRRDMIQQIAAGEIDIVVGTHSLLHEEVKFPNLALVVIDEQHRFGVRQRAVMREKNLAPHCLVMTATPIPRTLAMTVFGELDISVIRHLPPHRKPVRTLWYPPEKIGDAYEFIRSRLRQKEQVYFVYPRLESQQQPDTKADQETPPVDMIKAATDQYEYLREKIFPEFEVGLVHGQMPAAGKDQTMRDFHSGRIQVLVATVVVEVGLDVPQATIMVIEHADRFGLAQLHQLRGRIGRGDKSSYCLLFGHGQTDAGRQRLEIMTQTNDGFRIAQEDLALRGPGQFFGTGQHGLGELKIAHLIDDYDLLQMARRDAFAMLENDPRLERPSHRVLRKNLLRKFGENLSLVDVG